MQRPNNINVGDKFRVIKGYNSFKLGEIITLYIDDGSTNPYFWKADRSDFWSIYFSQLEPLPKTIRDAQAGDIVVNRSRDEHMVLERGQNIVTLSQANNFKKADGIYHLDELEEYFTLKDAPEVVDDKTAEAEIGITAHDLGKLESLRRLCIDEDLLDLDSYDSMGRSGEISNAWEALRIIEALVKKLTKKD